jgi:hypothetical protein
MENPDAFALYLVTPHMDEFSKSYKKLYLCKPMNFSPEEMLLDPLNPVFRGDVGGNQRMGRDEVMCVAIPISTTAKQVCVGGSKTSKDAVVRHTLMIVKQELLSRLSGNGGSSTGCILLPWVGRFSFKSPNSIATLCESTLPPMLLNDPLLSNACIADNVLER